MTAHQIKTHNYLGMTLEHSEGITVKVSMI